MTIPRPLPAARLVSALPPDRIPWASSAEMPHNGHRRAPQPRALHALELALHIDAQGYNIYLSGEANLGRIYMIRDFLAPRARRAPTPPDLLYVNNFEDEDRPVLLTVPCGMGRKIKNMVSDALTAVRRELPGKLEHGAFARKRSERLEAYQNERARLLRQMDRLAGVKGFNLEVDEQGGLTLYPLVDGKRLNETEFEALESNLRQEFKQKGDKLLEDLSGLVRKLSRAEKTFRSDERRMEQEVVRAVLDAALAPAVEKILQVCPGNAALEAYLKALGQDILHNPDSFLPREAGPPQAGAPPPDMRSAACAYLYEVNVFVDNSATRGAPLVIDNHPTPTNLLGCIERKSEMGALVTDFTLIKAGALHRANGGFLVLRMEDILQHPGAWEGLLRALRSGQARLEDVGDAPEGAVRAKGIEPDPLPVSLKVILVGAEHIYDSLLEHDDRFPKLFKIKAHMAETTPRDAVGIRNWVISLARIVRENNLLHFDREALAGLVDFSSRLCEDQRKLSLRMPQIRDVMVEASAIAAMRGESMTGIEHLKAALDSRMYRSNLDEQIYMEEYDQDLIKVSTRGQAVGRVNGLSVSWHGDFEFGLAHQISCTVGVGHGGIIDLEREAELSGPIHTKAILILKSYLVDQFARNKPLVLTGSLCFEQNYGGVEGDSASAAELAALLSAIAGAPVRLSLAFTGAVSQSGQILAVGSVTRKVEGFFDLCSRRGLTGDQGVLIPHDNTDHLMLSPRVLAAVDQNKFSIIPVRHITEALELLTGLPAGRPLKKGGFTPGSLYDRVDSRLHELGRMAEHAHSRPERRGKRK
jgi:predicted ATP-dependent protease